MDIKRLNEINERKLEIRSQLEGDGEVDLESLKAEIEKLNAEEAEIRSRQDMASSINVNEIETRAVEKPAKIEVKKVNSTFDSGSMEYRNAFKDFVMTGTMPEEFRTVALAANNQAVIPETILNQIVEESKEYGTILPLVTRTNYAAGVSIPTSQLTADATWMTDATLASTGVAVEAKNTTPVSFTAYLLGKALGISFLTQVQSLSAFEAAVASNVSIAMTRAIEQAIISGDGSGKPTGILAATPKKNVTLSAALDYQDLVKIVKAVPAAYRSGTALIMNPGTFYDFQGIVDTTGQPVARVNYGINGAPIYTILGIPVVATDYMTDLDSAASGAVVAAAIDPKKYVLNVAKEPDLVVYTEQATRNKVYQSVAAVDGKVVDAGGLVFVKKA